MAPPKVSREQAQQAVDCLRVHGGNKQHAARSLGLNTATFNHRLFRAKEYGLSIPSFDSPPGQINTSHIPATSDLLIDRLKKENKALQDEARRLREGQLSAALVRELIHDTRVVPDPPDWFIEREKQSNHGVPTLLCSDWHWGEVVKASQVNYVNAFDREIAERRVKLLVQKTVNLMLVHMAKPKYDYLCMPLLGDMLSGMIHEELRETNWSPMSLCMVQLRDLLIWAIDELLNAFKRLYIPCITGNHGRMDRKPRFKNAPYENYEWLVYEQLRFHYRGEKAVHFEIPDASEYLYELSGTRYLAMHGDGFKGGSGIAGVLSPMMIGRARKKESAAATNRPFDVMIYGHWHDYKNLSDVIVNGSLKGYDEYALKNNFRFQIPIQALWVTHPDYGITASWPIYLEKPGVIFR
jgi:hypothetical protein